MVGVVTGWSPFGDICKGTLWGALVCVLGVGRLLPKQSERSFLLSLSKRRPTARTLLSPTLPGRGLSPVCAPAPSPAAPSRSPQTSAGP